MVQLEKKRYIRKTVPLFLVLVGLYLLLLSGLLFGYHTLQKQSVWQELRLDEQNLLGHQRLMVQHYLSEAIRDAAFLAQENDLMAYLEEGEPEDARELSKEFSALMRTKNTYDQIRFLDNQDQERIRVNYYNGRVTEVPAEQLQNKRGRYYCTEGQRLQRHEFYLSPLDLNVERGRVERPFKPTVRIVLPVFDSKDKRRGLLVINMLAQRMLNDLQNRGTRGRSVPLLLNQDGFYLQGSRPGDAWSWQVPEQGPAFARQYPREWKIINKEQEGMLRTANGFFAFSRVHPASGSFLSGLLAWEPNRLTAEQYWILVNLVDPARVQQLSVESLNNLKWLAIVLFSLGLPGTWFVAFSYILNQANKQEMARLALHDSLTGLPNRRLLYDRLTAAVEHAERYERMAAVVYIDLDGFKQVNDQHGHEAGDDLLVQVGQRLHAGSRKADTVGRLGGDEFVCVLFEVNAIQGAEQAAAHLLAELNRPFDLDGIIAIIGASMGIAVFPDHDRQPEILMALADHAMYQAKKRGKNQIVIHDVPPESPVEI